VTCGLAIVGGGGKAEKRTVPISGKERSRGKQKRTSNSGHVVGGRESGRKKGCETGKKTTKSFNCVWRPGKRKKRKHSWKKGERIRQEGGIPPQTLGNTANGTGRKGPGEGI